MKYELNDRYYEVEIIKKNNKNTYVRVKENKICVTTNFFVTKSQIKKILDNNSDSLIKMLEKNNNKDESFRYLGKKYDIIIVPTLDIEISDNMIFVKNQEFLDQWIKNQTNLIFQERLDYIYNKFYEKIPYPNLKIRKMKTRWGVCNRKNDNVTLNSELIKYDYEQIDYVITHELSHFVHFNHSKEFWNTVCKYCPDYKKIRKSLKDAY